MSLTVTPFYASLLGLQLIFLSLRVIRLRRRSRVPLGDGGDETLLRCLRVQGNFAEYVPFCLLLIALAELQGLPVWPLHGLGLALLAGRLIHASGVSRDPEPYRLRVIGMFLTFAVLGFGAALNLLLSVQALL
ncbi:MAPEG family protein [Algihabitans albus]|uniref:MAPEG family protein n=1 Tax=Algihabitans albus TaxID=2164067 RepID=UPI000E5D9BD9|nr:MAPEG family protein [Algihabitans albus]